MDGYLIFLIVVGVLVIAAMVKVYSMGRHPCATALFCALIGICLVLGLNLAAPLIGPTVKLNFYTCGIAAVLGAPGVVGLLFLKLIFKV